MNKIFYGDNLKVLRNDIPDESIDLIYLDPPFNSKRSYNILFEDESGNKAISQIKAFDDSWHWGDESNKIFEEIIEKASSGVLTMIASMKEFIGTNQMMAYLVMMTVRLIELHRVLKPTGSIYLHVDPTASHYLKIIMDGIFGGENFRNEIVWGYKSGGASKNHWAKKHDIILFYSKSKKYLFNTQKEKAYTKAKGRKPGIINYGAGTAEFFEDEKGVYNLVNMRDIWEISYLNSQDKERLGYPTQKPLQLLERIIKASSNEGDIVLDPFCGCGTAIDAAQKLNRKWIGIDITHLATNIQKLRLKERFGLIAGKDYKIIGEPESLEDAKELFSQDPYEFQKWALSLISAWPEGSKDGKTPKKGGDKGIDGRINFTDLSKVSGFGQVIIQVKGGKVGPSIIRDLVGTVEREQNADIGILLTLEPPTKGMVDEASKHGNITHDGNKYSKIQIVTVEELLSKTKDIKIPKSKSPYKKALESNEGKRRNDLLIF